MKEGSRIHKEPVLINKGYLRWKCHAVDLSHASEMFFSSPVHHADSIFIVFIFSIKFTIPCPSVSTSIDRMSSPSEIQMNKDTLIAWHEFCIVTEHFFFYIVFVARNIYSDKFSIVKKEKCSKIKQDLF